jgi:hypothetical protein
MNLADFTEDELITIEGLVNDHRKWCLIKKVCQRRILDFWDRLRLTDPADEQRVASNHKLAVGVEASLGALVDEIEQIANHRQYKKSEPAILADQTEQLYE